MNVRHVPSGVPMVALIASALYMALTVAAYAHTLPMSEIRRGILDAVDDNFTKQVKIRIYACQRWNAHAGQCEVRVYRNKSDLLPSWCGRGWAKLIGNTDNMHVHGSVTPCPTSNRSPEPKGGNPITASLVA